MPNNVQFCELAFYADDTCLFTSSTDPGEIERKLTEDILSLSKWLKDNKLMVNSKKCEVMFIGTHQALLFYKSVIQCNFDYCSTVWTNCSKSHLNQLQILSRNYQW